MGVKIKITNFDPETHEGAFNRGMHLKDYPRTARYYDDYINGVRAGHQQRVKQAQSAGTKPPPTPPQLSGHTPPVQPRPQRSFW